MVKEMTNKDKIIEISKKLKLSHIGSCLSVLPILEEIYKEMRQPPKPGIIILDNAHAHLAHMVVIQPNVKYVEEAIERYGIHCDRKAGCHANGGSLGHGLGIGIGFALFDRKRDVHVIVSDGSMMEGSNWEALRIKSSLKLDNLKIYCNFNGFSAVQEVDTKLLIDRMRAFCSDIKPYWTDNGMGDNKVKDHYTVL